MSDVKLVPWDVPSSRPRQRVNVDTTSSDGYTYLTLGFELDDETQQVDIIVEPNDFGKVRDWLGQEYQLVQPIDAEAVERAMKVIRPYVTLSPAVVERAINAAINQGELSHTMSTHTAQPALEARAIVVAARHFAEVFEPYVCLDIGGKLTCPEADAFAGLLEAAGKPEHAEALMEAHAQSDEPSDEHYQPNQEA